MTHEQIREMISAGERTADVDAHLVECAACRAWTETFERIQRVAPQIFAEAPDRFAENVMTAARAAIVVVPAVAEARSVGSFIRRRIAWRMAMAGAVAAGVAAAAIVLPRSNQQPPSVAVAAKTTEAARTARFELTTSFELTPAKPIRVPAPNTAAIAASVRRNVPTGLPPALQDALRQTVADLPQPKSPRSITSISASASGRGEIVFPDRMHFVAQVTENDGVTRQSGKTETLQIGAAAWVRTALFGSKWVRMPGFGAEIAFVFQPADFIARVGDFDGATTIVGVETRNGKRVRHYRFTDSRSLGSFLGKRSVAIDAWVGVDDRRLHELTEAHTGDNAQGHLVMREHVRLFDFGAHVSVSAPPAGQTTTIDAVAAGFYGYGFGMAGGSFQFSFEAAGRMPDFSFPEIRLPELRLPDIKLPEFKLPDFDLPPFTIPSFSPPSFPEPQ